MQPPSSPAGGCIDLNENALVEAAVRGDRQALSELFDQYFPRVYRYALIVTGQPADAEDVASETFLVAVRRISEYRPTGAPFVSWLFAIARKTAASGRRKQGVVAEPAQQVTDGVSVQDEVEMRIDVLRVLDELPTDQREVVALRVYGGMSAAEIGHATGKSSNAVRQLQFRAFARLAQSNLVELMEAG